VHLDIIKLWNARMMLTSREKARLTSSAFIISCSTLTLLPEWVTSQLSVDDTLRASPASLSTPPRWATLVRAMVRRV